MPKVNKVGEPLRSARIKVSTTNENYLKLKKLSVSCDKSISEIIDEILNIGLNNYKLVQYLQDHYNKNPDYKIYPISEGNKIRF